MPNCGGLPKAKNSTPGTVTVGPPTTTSGEPAPGDIWTPLYQFPPPGLLMASCPPPSHRNISGSAPPLDILSPVGPPPGPPPRPPFGQQNYGPQGSQQLFPVFPMQRRKKLLHRINYFRQEQALRGCINDPAISRDRFRYNRNDIVVLTDDQQDPRAIPTKDNILRAMNWLVMDARPHDSLFSITKDLDGDEEDGFDEVIYPVDFKTAGHIVDDLMHDIMVKSLPPGCRLTAIFDATHGNSLNLTPSQYSTEGKIKEPNLALEAGQGLLSAASSYARGDMGGVLQTVTGFVRTATTGRSAQAKARATKTSRLMSYARISWSGCKDSQTSADAEEAGSATGAMSYAFITALNQQPRQSYQQLLQSLRGILRAKYSQKPQLSCSHPMDTNLEFIA
ncbi:caspase domain-containing protein [Russula aff. rugulosa BPL654]|nr:caspase domain-containing protein [Russula aff. rugulosa BPL654]